MARPHKKLDLWKESINLIKEVYSLLKDFPEDEKYGIINQIKRASVSILTNIAEGAARNTSKEFFHFLVISQGSLSELDALFEISKELSFISEKQYQEITIKMEKIDAMLNGLKKNIKSKF